MTTFRFTTAGESHGPGLVTIVEGMPAGLELDREALDRDMARRQLGHGRGGRMKIETDTVEVRSGIELSRQLGGRDRAGLLLFHISNAHIYVHNPGSESLVFTWHHRLQGS